MRSRSDELHVQFLAPVHTCARVEVQRAIERQLPHSLFVAIFCSSVEVCQEHEDCMEHPALGRACAGRWRVCWCGARENDA